MTNQLTDEQLQRVAPSVFATQPWHEQSEQYRFIPTIQVVNGLRDSGFYPVKAMQSFTRIPNKGNFAKHVLRFRKMGDHQVNDIIPEIVLTNSHDGSSAYQISLGLFRLVCSNGLTVADSTIQSVRVTHRGSRDLCEEVIDVSGRVLEDAPRMIGMVDHWRGLELSEPEQMAYAESARTLYDSNINVGTDRLLWARRRADQRNENGSRDLWRTYNVVQENMVRGGLLGKTKANKRRRTVAINSVDRDSRLNKALWELTQKMAQIKGEGVIGNG